MIGSTRRLATTLGAGLDHGSAVAGVALVALYANILFHFDEFFHPALSVDWLLTGIWVVLSLLVIWGVDVRRDAMLVAVAFVGGACIEWWGTNTGLWSYFNGERPPLFILPAWPIVAVAIKHLAQLSDRISRGRRGSLYWVVLPSFVAWFLVFLWPVIGHPASWAVILIMVAVTCLGVRPNRDLVLFAAGTGIGMFLEYWGTSRMCWVYYTIEMPPAVVVPAHGFASLAFARGVELLEATCGDNLGNRRARRSVSPPRMSAF